MRSDYKRLGDYIREVDVRNRDLAVTNLLGVSVSKEFIPSIANTIGTDMSSYKVVRRGQFVYIADTSRRGDKIAIALLTDEKAIVSSIYTSFEVRDENELLPEYLMMWFRRPEFDRYARFKSHGSAREIFDWAEMCEVRLPIPSISRQRELVTRYETLTRRICLNETLITDLEVTAQTLYRHLFVDNIDPSHLPAGWRMGTLGDLGEIVGGATPSTAISEYWTEDGIAWLSPADLSKQGTKFIKRGTKDITNLGFKSCSTKILPANSVLFSSRAPIGLMAINTQELCTNQGFKSIIPKEEIGCEYTYYCLVSLKQRIADENAGSTFSEVSGQSMKQYEAVIPPQQILQKFSKLIKPIFKNQELLEKEFVTLKEMQSLILTKLVK